MQCTIARPAPGSILIHMTDGFGLMRKRLVAWTILTCALLAVTVWTVLGPPHTPPGTHLPSRTAAIR